VKSAQAITLDPGLQAYATLDNSGVLTIGVPKGDKGDSVKSAVAVTVDSSRSATASLNTDTGVLTIEVPRGATGATGAQGPSGLLGGWQIVEVVGGNNGSGQWVGTAPCDTDNGYVLTGGGFEAPFGLGIIVSMPLKGTDQDGNEIGIGWKVVAEPIDDIRNGPFTVYAICACVDPKGCPKATP